MLDEAQARRLARAICADVLLYNGAATKAAPEQRAALLAEPVQEGRALFASRVAPEHQFVFDQAVDELIARPHGVELRALLTKQPAIVGQPMPRIGAPIAESSSAMPVVIAVAVLLLLTAAALVFFLVA